jgi:hypothetical protein
MSTLDQGKPRYSFRLSRNRNGWYFVDFTVLQGAYLTVFTNGTNRGAVYLNGSLSFQLVHGKVISNEPQ